MAARVAEATGPESVRNGDTSVAIVDDRFSILTGKPLPGFATAVTDAFAADDQINSETPLVALVGSPDLPQRDTAVEILRGIEHPHVMRLVHNGLVALAADRVRRPALIYERPGGSLVADGHFPSLSEQDIRDLVIAPVCDALRVLHARRLAHCAIRPDNLFFAGPLRDRVVLGDCISGVPGLCQPAVYEPLERALAVPAGRGVGGAETDMYALGVTVLALLLGETPGAGVPPDELLKRRLMRGSYAALCGKQRFTLRFEELLVGLLTDPVDMRWGLIELSQWLSGRRISSSPVRWSERASKPFIFNDIAYDTPRGLAEAFNRDWDDAVPAIRGGQVEEWLEKVLKLPSPAGVVAARRQEASGSHGARRIGADEMVTRVCLALDPDGPLRYRGVCVTVNGLGSLLATAFADGRDDLVRALGAIIAMGLPIAWIEFRAQRRKAMAARLVQFVGLKRFTLTPAFSGGMERCLYELNPGFRCLSPLVPAAASHDMRAVLAGLDSADGGPARTGEWMDRHLAAFLATVLEARVVSRLAETLPVHAPEIVEMLMGLALLVSAQKTTRIGPLVTLARAVRTSLSPVIETFHSRRLRKRLARALDKCAEAGDLAGMERLLGNRKTRARDESGFKAAVRGYAEAELNIRRLRDDDSWRAARAIDLGHRLAARVAYVSLALSTAATLVGYA